MIEITSKKTGKIQIIDEDQWNAIVARGWNVRYDIKQLPKKELRVPVIPPELEKVRSKNKKII